MGDYIRHQSALDAIEAERKVVHHASQMECTEEACHDEYVITRVLERLAIRVQIIPSDDVRPVVRGRWIKSHAIVGIDAKTCDVKIGETDKCSECGEEFVRPIKEYKFCPNCGADMRGESGSEKNLHQI